MRRKPMEATGNTPQGLDFDRKRGTLLCTVKPGREIIVVAAARSSRVAPTSMNRGIAGTQFLYYFQK